MSVLKNKRHISKMQYVTNAYAIERQSLDFVKRLTVKNSRIYQEPITRLAMLQADIAYIANEIYPSSLAEFHVRRVLLYLSEGILHALDKRMSDVYQSLMDNPQEAFCRQNGKPFDKDEAILRLDKMAERLGCAIDEQDALLKGIRKADKEKSKSLPSSLPGNDTLTSFVQGIVATIIDTVL